MFRSFLRRHVSRHFHDAGDVRRFIDLAAYGRAMIGWDEIIEHDHLPWHKFCGREDWGGFSRRLDVHFVRMERLGVAFRPRRPLP